MLSDYVNSGDIYSLNQEVMEDLLEGDSVIFTRVNTHPQGSTSAIIKSPQIEFDPNDISKVISAKEYLPNMTERKHAKMRDSVFSFNGAMYSIGFNIADSQNIGLALATTQLYNGLTVKYDKGVFNGTNANIGYYNNVNNAFEADIAIDSITNLTQAVGKLVRICTRASRVKGIDLLVVISGSNLLSYLDGVEGSQNTPNSETLDATCLKLTGKPYYALSEDTSDVDRISVFSMSTCVLNEQLPPSLTNMGRNEELEYTFQTYKHGQTGIDIVKKGGAVSANVTSVPDLSDSPVSPSKRGKNK